MTELSTWAGRMKPTQYVYRLERENDTTGLYMMKERVGNGVPCYYYTSPVYYVWIDDVCVFTTMDYKTACAIYENRRKEMFEIRSDNNG